MITTTLGRAGRGGITLAAIALGALACGGGGGERPVAVAPTPAAGSAAPPPAMTIQPVVDKQETEHVLPTACADGPMCTPPKDFAERICAGSFPEAALYLFAPKTPWKRAYLRRSFQAWQVSGRGEMRELHTSEEVLILTVHHGASQGMQIGGRAFDVLRWDGTCVSLMEDEISFSKPPAAVPADIVWKKLDPTFQAAFSEERGIEALRSAQVRTCETPLAEKEPGKSNCEIARQQLSIAIAQSIGKGKTLPALTVVP